MCLETYGFSVCIFIRQSGMFVYLSDHWRRVARQSGSVVLNLSFIHAPCPVAGGLFERFASSQDIMFDRPH